MRTADFDYVLPEELIAQVPADPRDSSRLLDARDLGDHTFKDLPRLLRGGDLLVVNRTRVRPARLRATKTASGGGMELLLLKRIDKSRWEALVRPARKVRAGAEFVAGQIRGTVESGPVEGHAIVSLESPIDIESALVGEGRLPLPPYITGGLAEPDRYQTIWADRPGSAAAPTAGLHFTPGLVDELITAGIGITSVDLEVGLATFRPITSDFIADHEMHREVFRVGEEAAAAIDRTRRLGGRIIAVGTTSVRALEAMATGEGGVRAGEGETDLYLYPGSRFSVVDGLVTNFHMPRSSLIVLLAAFMGAGWRQVYRTAIERRYRFLSFGDAMYCERA